MRCCRFSHNPLPHTHTHTDTVACVIPRRAQMDPSLTQLHSCHVRGHAPAYWPPCGSVSFGSSSRSLLAGPVCSHFVVGISLKRARAATWIHTHSRIYYTFSTARALTPTRVRTNKHTCTSIQRFVSPDVVVVVAVVVDVAVQIRRGCVSIVLCKCDRVCVCVWFVTGARPTVCLCRNFHYMCSRSPPRHFARTAERVYMLYTHTDTQTQAPSQAKTHRHKNALLQCFMLSERGNYSLNR